MAATSTASIVERPSPSWLFRPGGFLLLMALLQLIHLALRPILSATVGTDDTDQLLFSQVLAPGYSYEQLPLYTWLMWLATQVFGPTVLAVAVVKYGLVFLIHAFTYLAARRALTDPRLQVAAGLSPMAFYPIGWRLHEADTYSVLSTVLTLAVAWLTLVLLRDRRLPAYLGLGVALGLGLLSSGFFAIGALALLLALTAVPEGRKALLNWRLPIALLVAAAIVWPTAQWIAEQGPAFWERVWSQMNQGHTADLDPWYLRAYKGLEALVLSGFPFWLIVAVVFFDSLRPLPRGTVRASVLGRVLWAYLPFLALVTVVATIALDLHKVSNFRLYPAALPLVLLVFWRIERFGPRAASLRWAWLVFALLAVVIVQARFQHIEAGPAFCKVCRMQAPYPQVADIVRQAGFDGRGTIIAGDNYVAGNFHLQFPEARVLTPRYPEFAPPRRGSGDGPCLVIWHDDMDEGSHRRFWDYLAANGIVMPPADEIPLTVVEVPHTPRIIVPNRTIEMRYVLFPGRNGTCG